MFRETAVIVAGVMRSALVGCAVELDDGFLGELMGWVPEMDVLS
jgi:hypothetical protein